jgi:hypothetical protein
MININESIHGFIGSSFHSSTYLRNPRFQDLGQRMLEGWVRNLG